LARPSGRNSSVVGFATRDAHHSVSTSAPTMTLSITLMVSKLLTLECGTPHTQRSAAGSLVTSSPSTDRPLRGRQHAGDQIEQRRLAGAVGSIRPTV
jgi:hypothetical protein